MPRSAGAVPETGTICAVIDRQALISVVVVLAAAVVAVVGYALADARTPPLERAITTAGVRVRVVTRPSVTGPGARPDGVRRAYRGAAGGSPEAKDGGQARARGDWDDPPALFSAADRRSFARLAARLAGREGLAVSGVGRGQPVQELGSLSGGVSWSTSKVPVGMAAVDAGVADPEDLRQAITVSDNAAAERLWSALGGGRQAARATDRALRAAGDASTKTEHRRLRAGFTPFGQTMWPLAAQTRFTGGLGCSASGKRLLGLMNRIIRSERWGLGAAGVPARFKGGWGPGITPGSGDGWLERQMGVLTVNDRRVALTIASAGTDHSTATRALTTLARWAVAHVDASELPRVLNC
jgi:hypothetical protein